MGLAVLVSKLHVRVGFDKTEFENKTNTQIEKDKCEEYTAPLCFTFQVLIHLNLEFVFTFAIQYIHFNTTYA